MSSDTSKLPAGVGFIQILETNDPGPIDFIANDASLPFAESKLFKSAIRSVKVISREGEDKRVLEINLQSLGFNYAPGATIGILPLNNAEEVDYILTRCGDYNRADKPIILESKNEKKPVPNFVPKRTTIRNILTWCLNIRTVPKKALLKLLSLHTSNINEKTELLNLSSPKHGDDYTTKILTPGLTFLNLLKLYPTCTPPIELLIENLPRLLPRPYSISSSPQSKTISFILSVVKFQGSYGVCSGWLNQFSTLEHQLENLSLVENSPIHYYFRKSNIKFPIEVPIIMVGPGTGVAPFLGYIQDLTLMKIKPEELWLFYGCRYRDDILGKKLKNYSDVIEKLFVAYSRDEGNYVQDLLKENMNEVFELVDKRNGVIFVCGDGVKMAKGVRKEFVDGFVKVGKMEEEDGLKYLNNLVLNKRYVEDVWS